MKNNRHQPRMIRVDDNELGRMQEKDLAMFYEGLCSIKNPTQKPRSMMAGWFEVNVKTYDKIKQGKAHGSVKGWIVASKELETTLWSDWLEVQKKKYQ